MSNRRWQPHLWAAVLSLVLLAALLWGWMIPQGTPPPKAGHTGKAMALLINNDPAPRHRENLQLALQALQPFSFQQIIALGDSERIPCLSEVRAAFLHAGRNSQRVFVYLTGHGQLILNRRHPEGLASMMLQDHPLTPDLLASWLGDIPCVLYCDQCYAPGFIEGLQHCLQGNYLLFSDKTTSNPVASCRTASGPLWHRLIEWPGIPAFPDSLLESWRAACPPGAILVSSR